MPPPSNGADSSSDPLIAALELLRPVDAAVLDAAIKYREALVDQLVQEIDTLNVARARLLNAPVKW